MPNLSGKRWGLIIFLLLLLPVFFRLIYLGYVELFGHEAHGIVIYRDVKGRERIFQLNHCETVTGYDNFAVYDEGKNGIKVNAENRLNFNNTNAVRSFSSNDLSVQLLVDGKLVPWKRSEGRQISCQVKNSTLTFTPGRDRQMFLQFGGGTKSSYLKRFAHWDGTLDAECTYNAVTSTIRVDVRGCK